MSISLVAGVSWAVGALALGVFFLVFSRLATAPAVEYPPLAARAYRIRPFWLLTLGATLLALLLATLPYLPYEGQRLARLGAAAGTPQPVVVHATQYAWNLSGDKLPAKQPVEFQVTSDDVTHGFGVYDPSDHIVGQVQAMPGFTNHLVMRFEAPGDYTIRCLEYCGPGHSHMTGTFHVACGPSGC